VRVEKTLKEANLLNPSELTFSPRFTKPQNIIQPSISCKIFGISLKLFRRSRGSTSLLVTPENHHMVIWYLDCALNNGFIV
jgi:hypothetical protein